MALVGIRRSEEFKEKVAAVEWRLSAEDREQIDRDFAEEGVPTPVDTPQRVEPLCRRDPASSTSYGRCDGSR